MMTLLNSVGRTSLLAFGMLGRAVEDAIDQDSALPSVGLVSSAMLTSGK